MKRKNREPCVYCHKLKSPTEMTTDHVPPRSLFTKPWPDNLITVPACVKCNGGFQNDDDYFIAHLIASAQSASPSIPAKMPEFSRMIENNKGPAKLLKESIRFQEFFTPSGLTLGMQPVLKINHERIASAIRHLVRGLYYHEYKERLEIRTKIMCRAVDTSDKGQWLDSQLTKMRKGSREFVGTFEYRFVRTSDNPQASLWAFLIYGGMAYVGMTGKVAESMNVNTSPFEMYHTALGPVITRNAN